MSLLSVFFHLQDCVLVFWNFNSQWRYLWKSSLCPWNQPHFLRNSDKSLLSPEQKNLKKSETCFCRRKAAEDNSKINIFPNIPCTFLLFKASVFVQIFFPRNLLFWQVFRLSAFLNSKCLKTLNKRRRISLLINQFVCLIEEDVAIDKLLN